MAAWKWPTAAVAVAVGVARLGSWARGKGKWWLRAGPLPSSERGFGGPGRAGLCLACSLVLFGLGFGHLVRPFFLGVMKHIGTFVRSIILCCLISSMNGTQIHSDHIHTILKTYTIQGIDMHAMQGKGLTTDCSRDHSFTRIRDEKRFLKSNTGMDDTNCSIYTISALQHFFAKELSQNLWLSNPYYPGMTMRDGLQRYPLARSCLPSSASQMWGLARQQIKHRAATQSYQCPLNRNQIINYLHVYCHDTIIETSKAHTPFKSINHDNAHNSKKTVNVILLSSCSLQYFPLHGESASQMFAIKKICWILPRQKLTWICVVMHPAP
jgi:hypothetical protein